MIISSREWRIIENNKSSNAEFHDFYNDGDGCFKPTIILGTQTNNKTEILYCFSCFRFRVVYYKFM